MAYIYQLQDIFVRHDKNQDGHLTRDELLPILTELIGYDASPYVNEVMLIADMDGSGTINSLQELDLALKKTGTVELTTIFRKYDKDGNFGLSKAELIPLLQDILGFPPGPIADQVMQIADCNRSGRIDSMSELQRALVQTKAIKVYTLRNMFAYFDAHGNRDGFITADEVLKVTEGMPAHQKDQLMSLFGKADVNCDGKVSLDEYLRFMMK